MLVARPVEGRRAGGHDRGKAFGIEPPLDPRRDDRGHHVQEIAPVAVGHRTKRRPRLVFKRKFGSEMRFNTLQERIERLARQPFQHHHLRPRQQRAVQRE